MVSALACFGCGSRAAVQTDEADVVDQQQHQQQQQIYHHSYDPIKPAAAAADKQGGNRQAVLYVRMASMSSSGGADSTGGASDSSEPAAAEEVWFEAEEQADWLAAPELGSISEAAPDSSSEAGPCLTAEQLAALAVLPAQLQKLLTKYLQGTVGCKPLVALMRYMQDSNTSLAVLQDMLQPLLDAEQHLPPQMPVPSPQMTPAELSAFLRSQQLQQAHHPASTSTPQQQQQQSSQPRIAHLLKTLGLAVRTLSIMDQEDGFRQVASGPLSLWYRHDTEAKAQVLRARVVLDESVATIAAIAREFDLVTSWNPGMSDLRELATYSATEVLIYLLPWMPWPLPLPEMINFGFAVDLLDLQPRCVLLHTSSAEAPPGVEVPKHSRALPIHMEVGGFRLSPLPPSPDKPDTPRTEVTVLVSIDAARFVIPDNIISCVLKVFAPLVHKSVLKVFARMFHTTIARAGPSAGGSARSSSPTTCSTSLLVERLGLRPEYAVLDAHAARVLAAEAQAAAGSARPLELDTPRTSGAGIAV